MIGRQPSRGGTDESMEKFVARRYREAANRGPDARAAAHEAYGNAIRTGRDLRLLLALLWQ